MFDDSSFEDDTSYLEVDKRDIFDESSFDDEDSDEDDSMFDESSFEDDESDLFDEDGVDIDSLVESTNSKREKELRNKGYAYSVPKRDKPTITLDNVFTVNKNPNGEKTQKLLSNIVNIGGTVKTVTDKAGKKIKDTLNSEDIKKKKEELLKIRREKFSKLEKDTKTLFELDEDDEEIDGF